jgi:hypothetical protein
MNKFPKIVGQTLMKKVPEKLIGQASHEKVPEKMAAKF